MNYHICDSCTDKGECLYKYPPGSGIFCNSKVPGVKEKQDMIFMARHPDDFGRSNDWVPM